MEILVGKLCSEHSDLKGVINEQNDFVFSRSSRIMKKFWSCHSIMNRNGYDHVTP